MPSLLPKDKVAEIAAQVDQMCRESVAEAKQEAALIKAAIKHVQSQTVQHPKPHPPRSQQS